MKTDPRFDEVEKEKDTALNKNQELYDNMISQSDKFYQDQIDAAKDYAKQQQEIQNQMTNQAITEINQQKEQSRKDYEKEQSGAYVDWKKQSNDYGVNAEREAEMGMNNTGYSESAQVSMYNTYQNRHAVALESYNRAKQNYDNAITQARLQNNYKLAEIAYQSLNAQLELSLKGFQYKNNLLMQQTAREDQITDRYNQQWQQVLQQINHEEAFAEQKRQYDEQMAFQKEKYEDEKERYKEQMARMNSGGGGRVYSSSGSTGGSTGGSGGESVQLKSSGKQYEVDTPYYRGNLNPDAHRFGTFSNGYQPKGIIGHGTLSKSKEPKITFTTQDRNGQYHTVTQTVWKTSDGRLWYWEGRENRYKPLSNAGNKAGQHTRPDKTRSQR